jgi:hypothetical protein
MCPRCSHVDARILCRAWQIKVPCKVPWLDLQHIHYIWVNFRTRSHGQMRKIRLRLWGGLAHSVAHGTLALRTSAGFELERRGEALDLIAAGWHFGKIVGAES